MECEAIWKRGSFSYRIRIMRDIEFLVHFRCAFEKQLQKKLQFQGLIYRNFVYVSTHKHNWRPTIESSFSWKTNFSHR